MCGWMEGNKTVYKNMGCHSEHTVILHKHLKGADQVCKLVIVPMCQRSSLHPRHCKRCQLSWSAGEMLQCLVVISVSHRQNKHSKISSSLKFPQVCCQPRACFVQTVCTVGCRRIRWNYICLNPQFKRLLWCTSLWIPVNQDKPLQTQLPYLNFLVKRACQRKTIYLQNVIFSGVDVESDLVKKRMMMHFDDVFLKVM